MISDARPFTTVLSDAAGNVREIIRGELRLAYAELASNGAALRRAAIALTVAGVCAVLGLAYLSLAALFAIAGALPLWAAALIVGGASLSAAAAAVVLAKHLLKGVNGMPRTLATIEETTQWPMQSKS